MSTLVLLEPVFVLHHRPYQNSSLIVDFFSLHHGRVSAVARSARGPKSRFKGYLQLFSPLLASWRGKRELMNLNHLELTGLPYQLAGESLWCAFYLNELLLRLLPKDDPYPEVFIDYQDTLKALEVAINGVSPPLRRFEKRLLDRLGYGLSFSQINSAESYQWLPEQGFSCCDPAQSGGFVFSGRSLLALQLEQWEHPEDLSAAKRLLRAMLAQHLGPRPLKSRELLR